MDNQLTFRFYRVTKAESVSHDFVQCLTEIAGVHPKRNRERQTGVGMKLRLEELDEEDDGSIVGELVRLQDTNMPADLSDEGRSALNVRRGIGHGIIFRFDEPHKVLCIQHDPRIASVGRLMQYLVEYKPGAIFSAVPMLKRDAWTNFEGSGVRKITLKVAKPENLTADTSQSCLSSIRQMGRQYDAPNIKVEISMGHRKGTLAPAVKELAGQVANLFGGGAEDAELTSLKARLEGDSEDIDLIEERLKSVDMLELDRADPDENYRRKRQHIRGLMRDKREDYA